MFLIKEFTPLSGESLFNSGAGCPIQKDSGKHDIHVPTVSLQERFRPCIHTAGVQTYM